MLALDQIPQTDIFIDPELGELTGTSLSTKAENGDVVSRITAYGDTEAVGTIQFTQLLRHALNYPCPAGGSNGVFSKLFHQQGMKTYHVQFSVFPKIGNAPLAGYLFLHTDAHSVCVMLGESSARFKFDESGTKVSSDNESENHISVGFKNWPAATADAILFECDIDYVEVPLCADGVYCGSMMIPQSCWQSDEDLWFNAE